MKYEPPKMEDEIKLYFHTFILMTVMTGILFIFDLHIAVLLPLWVFYNFG